MSKSIRGHKTFPQRGDLLEDEVETSEETTPARPDQRPTGHKGNQKHNSGVLRRGRLTVLPLSSLALEEPGGYPPYPVTSGADLLPLAPAHRARGGPPRLWVDHQLAPDLVLRVRVSKKNAWHGVQRTKPTSGGRAGGHDGKR